jgi:glycine/D-amino acid oxidase-like deaminating enzyme
VRWSSAGGHGLSALYQLQRLGCKPLGLVERVALGHEPGSSHGHTRVTRSAYINIAAGFSVHGFKFGPLTGRALAELVLKGKTEIPEFEQLRPTFAART